MEIVICPFCGKENRAEDETCQYCQARLKPLRIDPESQPGLIGQSPGEESQVFSKKEGKPDSQDGLQASGEVTPAGKPAVSEPSDWLTGFRNQITTQDLTPGPEALDDERQPEARDIRQDFEAGAMLDDAFRSLPFENARDNEESYPEFLPDEPQKAEKVGDVAADDLAWLRELQSQYNEVDGLSSAASKKDEGWLAANELSQDSQKREDERVPRWVGEISAGSLDKQDSEAEGGLSASELPSWLDATRPLATPQIIFGMPSGYSDQVEIAGPLAGLPGLLPAEPEIALGRKAAAYPTQLQVSETNRIQAEIFDQVLQSEGQNRPLPDRVLVSSQKVMRMAFALIILFAILAPVFSLQTLERYPAITPVEVLSASQIISRIGSESPVLIAVEYEPGFSGELDAALAAVLDHLMIQGAFLVLVSSVPSGPMQAEHIVGVSNQVGPHQYINSASQKEYINLGYISGGLAGLRNFAENPRLSNPSDISGEPAWENPVMVNIDDINDFSLVIVASENHDKSRAWIEQTSPLLEDTPLIYVVSAQSEPLIRPFFDATPQQVQGIVSGVIGSVHYGATIGRQGIAHLYWPSFNSGLLAAAILIVVGGGANALLALTASKNGRKPGGKSL
ncbi:MAG: hypothetical protein A2Z16_06150 [Chloroflexi bacterium RBG_16_54_18]|nr:MAG: hypothetical protein A2Z16_06150 [Chloroflexi bacterium RBG_16_54_18]